MVRVDLGGPQAWAFLRPTLAVQVGRVNGAEQEDVRAALLAQVVTTCGEPPVWRVAQAAE